MNEINLNNRAKEIVKGTIYVTIATVCSDGSPWNTPVYSAFDSEYNFFWISSPNAQHSKNIVQTGKAFVIIFDSSQAEGTGEGVYMQGRTYEVTSEEEIAKAIPFLYDRKNKPHRAIQDFLGESPRRIYTFVPEQRWINTDVKVGAFHVDGRKEVNLKNT